MFVLVSTLAVVVVRYSRTYLAGERGLDRYARSLLLTVASVLVRDGARPAPAPHVLSTRRQAIIVAHKKFLLSRVADACFVVVAR